MIDFPAAFKELTGNPPLSWQTRLYEEHFANKKPLSVIDLPTGLGKTMIMAIWLIARANKHAVPTRLIYVVDRRTVVDQATDLAKTLVKNWNETGIFEGGPPAISTLRGQLADNREWSRDPSKPAIIIGTVDLIGSALLFSGYRSSYKRRPLEAGLLGQDSLLVLDEAHLSKPFEKLIRAINNDGPFQKDRDGKTQGAPMRVIRMSATSGETGDNAVFKLDTDPNSATYDLRPDPDSVTGTERNQIIPRFHATKELTRKSSTDVVDSIAIAAGTIAADNPGSRIVIFVKSPKDVDAVQKSLIKKDKSRETKIAQLTGTMRGLERDELIEPPKREDQHERRVMQRFLSPDNDPSLAECFLIATSAGEVGFDLNADHLVGDSAPLDSWIQRLGRVNRRGNGDATVLVVDDEDAAVKTEFDKACIATSELLTDGMYVGPKALADIKSRLTADQLRNASSPTPSMVELTDILLDAWSMTSIIQPMPGRPEVGPWLRGLDDALPQTTIAWRAELDESGFADLDLDDIEEWFETHRILTHETLSVPTSDAAKWLTDRWGQLSESRQSHLADRPIVIDRAGLILLTVKKLIDQLSRKVSDSTSTIHYANLILPASFGGVERGVGLLDASAPRKPADEKDYDDQARSDNVGELLAAPDVADIAFKRRREIVTMTEDGEKSSRVVGNGTMPRMPLKFSLSLESDEERRVKLVSFIPRREKPEFGSAEPESLVSHVKRVREEVDGIVDRLDLQEEVKTAAQLAADYHDHGKNRERWQRTVNGKATPPGQDWLESTLGKSGGEMKRDSRGYRHEFGSLREFTDAFKAGTLLDQAGNLISQDVFDVAMHLISTHHGRGRPHFPKGAFDPDAEARSDELHTESIRRFARLQRRYGWWRLAWLENLLRSADAIASTQINDGEIRDDEAKG